MNDTLSLPVTTEGVRDFLAGPWAAGIGPAYAARLTEHFGTDAVRVLAENPAEAAAAVPGLGSVRAEGASESLRAVTAPLGLLIFLCSCGIGETYIERILAKYRKRATEVVASDPYSMVEQVWQLSFFTADKIGRALGIPDGDPRRLTAALVTAVKRHAEQGHLFATHAEAVAEGARIAGVDAVAVEAQIATAVADGRLVESRG
ncbi:MAG: hypothetical protein K2H87_01595, partial [Duncaniella sp.]|nr:hypothetical protein [Duncaniella sp.]